MLKRDYGLVPAIVCGLLASVCLVGLNMPEPFPIGYLELPGLAVLATYALLSTFAFVFYAASALYAINWLLTQHVRRRERLAEVEARLAQAQTLTSINRLVEGLGRLNAAQTQIAHGYALVEIYGDYQEAMNQLNREAIETRIVPPSDLERARKAKAEIIQHALEHDNRLPAVRDLSPEARREYEKIVSLLGPLVEPAAGPNPARITDMKQALRELS